MVDRLLEEMRSRPTGFSTEQGFDGSGKGGHGVGLPVVLPVHGTPKMSNVELACQSHTIELSTQGFDGTTNLNTPHHTSGAPG